MITREIRYSFKDSLKLTLIGLAFVFGSFLIKDQPNLRAMSLLLFGAASYLGLSRLLFRQTAIEISAGGVRWFQGFKQQTYEWKHILSASTKHMAQSEFLCLSVHAPKQATWFRSGGNGQLKEYDVLIPSTGLELSTEEIRKIIDDGIKQFAGTERNELLRKTRDTGEPFLPYLKERITPSYPSEVPAFAEPLKDSCEWLLVHTDSSGVRILAALDAKKTSPAKFPFSRERLVEMFSPHVKAAQRIELFLIWVNESHSVRPEIDLKRTFSRARGSLNIEIQAAWINARALSFDGSGTYGVLPYEFEQVKNILEEPRKTEAELRPFPITEVWTLGIILVLLFVGFYGLETYAQRLSGHGWLPSAQTLIVLGGDIRSYTVDKCEFFRVLSSSVLHTSPLHLFMNSLALLFIVPSLQGLIGARFTLFLLLAGSVGGGIVSMLWNSPNIVSVGASGAILGLLGGAMLISTRLRVKHQRESLNLSALQMAIASLIPAGGSHVGTSVNYAAHAGGLVGGLLAGLAILALWPKHLPRPEPRAGTLLGAFAGVLYIAAIVTALVRAFA